MEKVSVIIPVYNVEKYLSACLDSVLNQTYENKEIIIVEDKSTDDSRRIVMEYQRMYPEIKIILNPDNRGLSYSRNKGLEEATGDLIAFIDSDDTIDTNFLEDIIGSMNTYHTDIGMCEYDIFIKNSRKDNREVKYSRLQITEENLGDMRECCWNKVYRRSLIGDMRFQPGTLFEDFPFTYPILIKAGQVSVVNNKLYHYRRNFKGISLGAKKSPNRGILDIFYSAQVLERNYKLVRKDKKYDTTLKQIVHLELLKMSFDASLWRTIHLKCKKEIVNMLYYLANRYSGYFKMTDNELVKRRLRKNLLFKLRALIMLLNKKDEPVYFLDEDDIMYETGLLIDKCNEHKCKVKEK